MWLVVEAEKYPEGQKKREADQNQETPNYTTHRIWMLRLLGLYQETIPDQDLDQGRKSMLNQ